MRAPVFVRRAVLRVLAGGAICAIAIAVAGLLGERLRYGADLPAARTRIADDVRRQFSSLSGQLEAAAVRIRAEAAVLDAASHRDLAGTRRLFDQLAEVASAI